MTNIQRAFCVVLSLIFLCVVAALPGDFFRHGEVYRSLPLYCFLEKKALQEENGRDRETEMLLQKKNAEHLGEEVTAENRREQEELLMAEAEKDAADSRDERQEETQAEKDKIVDESKSGVEEKKEKEEKEEQETVALPHPQIDLSQAKLADFDYVMNHFFILDSNTETNAGQISGTRFLEEDMSIKQDSSVPQILIYHTHSQETFSDSREGETEDTIVGVGNYLTDILEKNYGYKVIHVTDAFDIMGGELDRSKAYDYARSSIEKVLEENPTVEVVIDLHRDGVPDDRHLVTEINGKQTAQILFYNGLSYTVNQGAVSYLPNPYIEDNLAFSFQLEYQAAQYYPQFYRGIYLAGLRYNLHLRPRALLLEAGAQTNTVEEVRNAMEPFADILNRVLKGSDKEG
ncbi:MAG: stage II sporulation protein P [Blautia sp.]|nr:stage II sporulation protein P [Blautia sp.]